MSVQLTENFRAYEFRCRCADRGDYSREPMVYCGGIAVVHPSLAMMLQRLRSHFGVPVVINSGYRCPAYNRRPSGSGGVGGARRSRHMYGDAADIVVQGVDPVEVARVADEFGFRGVEVYPARGFVHVDMRPGELWRGPTFLATVGR